MDFNFHSVFSAAEEDVVGKVKPTFEKLLGEIEAELEKIGFKHVASVLTSDAGQQAVVPTPPSTELQPPPTLVTEPASVESPTTDDATLPTDAPPEGV